MIDRPFTIGLEGADGEYPALVQPKEENGIIRFQISGTVTAEGTATPWTIEIEPDCGGWKQTGDSSRTGPVMPCFFVEEMGEQVERHLKSL